MIKYREDLKLNLNNVDYEYCKLVKDILDNGHQKGDRTGTGTTSVYGRQIRFNMKDGFPLLTTKKLYTRGIITELLWFLNGDTNIKYLVDNNVNIWNEWSYKKYVDAFYDFDVEIQIADGNSFYNPELDEYHTEPYTLEEFIDRIKTDAEFADEHGDLGPIYGKQWVNWNKDTSRGLPHFGKGANSINQIQNLIDRLNTVPDCRRMIVSAWAVHDLPDMALMPCHYGFQVWTRELTSNERFELLSEDEKKKFIVAVRPMNGPSDTYDEVHYTLDNFYKHIPKREISLMWHQRSIDTGLGLPFNIASYGMLLEMIAQQVNMVPGELIGNLGDTHIYSNHIEQIKEQLKRESKECNHKLVLNKAKDIFSYQFEDFKIEGYEAHPSIKMPIAV